MGQFGGNADAKKSSSKRGYYTTRDESGIPEGWILQLELSYRNGVLRVDLTNFFFSFFCQISGIFVEIFSAKKAEA